MVTQTNNRITIMQFVHEFVNLPRVGGSMMSSDHGAHAYLPPAAIFQAKWPKKKKKFQMTTASQTATCF